MANRSIIYTWGGAIAGREAKGVGVFQEALGYWGAKQQAGEVSDVKVGVSQTGNVEVLGGYLLVEGDRAKLEEIAASEEYQQLNIKASHIVHNFTITHCDAGDAIPNAIERLIKVRADLEI